jgi:hypothetical protein
MQTPAGRRSVARTCPAGTSKAAAEGVHETVLADDHEAANDQAHRHWASAQL